MSLTRPAFSVVIPTFKRKDLLMKCLACLAPGAQSFPAGQYEIIVADDAGEKSELKPELSRHPHVKWVAGPGRGPASNRNKGAAAAQGEWLLFVDDDCLPCGEWIAKFAAASAAHPDVNVFEGRTSPDGPRRSLAEFAPINESGGYLWACNFAIRRSLYQEMGGFNEAFTYAAMEDVDLRVRLQALNHPIIFVPEALVRHPWRDNGGLPAAWKREEAARVFYRLHPERRETINFPAVVKNIIKRLLLETLPGFVRYRGRGFFRTLRLHAADIASTWRLSRRG